MEFETDSAGICVKGELRCESRHIMGCEERREKVGRRMRESGLIFKLVGTRRCSWDAPYYIVVI
jgi:hypothetical protein